MARKSRKNIGREELPALSVQCLQTALYIRLSVEDNKKHGFPIETQRMILEDYIAKQPELTIYDTYIDNGATGTNFQRQGFQRMLADIDAGHVQCVIVKDLSRLGRNAIDTGYYIEQYFPARQVRFIAVTDQFDTACPDNLHGGIILPLKNMINEAYSLDIGRKIKAQARQAMKDGDFVGASAPYGYRKDPDNCHKLLVDEEAAAVVRQIFQWAYEGMGKTQIARNLNEMGLLSPSRYKQAKGYISHKTLMGKGNWQTFTIEAILKNEAYTGDLVQGKTKTIDHQQMKAGPDNYIIARNTHEAIVSHELFNAVQAHLQRLKDKKLEQPLTPYSPNIFKGKIFCAHCGGHLNRQRYYCKKTNYNYYYRCLTNERIARGMCEDVTIREDELLPVVAALLEKELAAETGQSLTLLALEMEQKKEREPLKAAISAKRNEAERYRRLMRSLYENFAEGILTKDEYTAMKTGYEESISTLSGEIAGIEKQLAHMDARLARYKEAAQDAKALEQNHTLSADLVERLIERIEVSHDKEITVHFRFKDAFAASGEVKSI